MPSGRGLDHSYKGEEKYDQLGLGLGLGLNVYTLHAVRKETAKPRDLFSRMGGCLKILGVQFLVVLKLWGWMLLGVLAIALFYDTQRTTAEESQTPAEAKPSEETEA